ncbi:MAG: winged helix-turn-helix domain-containing protein [Acetobacteraceae bacterium]
MDHAADTPESIAFGRFRVLPHRRELLVGDQSIKLGGRAFDVLLALLEMPGAIVTKDELLARVWPDRVIAENNLQTQIVTLRQAFGSERGLIRTIAGRGYQFTGEVHVVSPGLARRGATRLLPVADGATATPTNLPQPVSELIGRDAEAEAVAGLVRDGRLVTLTGVGGVGKTRLALAVGWRLLPQFPDGVWLAELSPLADPSLVPATVAAAVGLELGGGESSARRVAQALAARRMLLVMDTCEHVIDAAATMADAVLRAGSAVHVIATSREPLRTDGEQLRRVPPLAVPAEDAEDLLEYGAVRLFVERARAADPEMVPDRRWAMTVASICRRLDGIPLAIEMAAARLASLGADELARRLDDRLQLLTGGRRTALPRQQTLRATLDWSHALLPEPERMLLRRLAVFAGAFSLEAAGAVVGSSETASPEVVDGIASLVAKSLVVAEVDAAVPRYRLLDTTRSYALEKLAESGERDRLARCHADYCRVLFERAESELESRPTAEWLGDYRRQIDNLRAALGWAFGPGGDAGIGVALTAAAVPLWIHLSLLEECRSRAERALDALGTLADGDPRRAMKLHAALGTALIYFSDATVPALGAAWTSALDIAERLDDAEYQLRSLLGLWFFNRAGGRLRAALAAGQKFCALAASRSNDNDRLIGERLIGIAEQFLGDQPSARRHLEHVLQNYVAPLQQSHIIRFQSDQRVTTGAFLARSLWLQGLADQAMRVTEDSVDTARASGHASSQCYVVAHAACPIALWTGALDVAEHYVHMLLDLSTRYSLTRWSAFGRSHQGLLVIKRGETAAGLQLLRSGLDDLGEINAPHRYFLFLGEMATALGQVGQIGEGLAALDEAIVRAEATEERWAMAELLRIRGGLLLMQSAPGAAGAAENHFREALDWAHRQGALAWELRVATSYAALLREQGRSADGIALLRPVHARFTEGFDTADLKAAAALLEALRAAEPVREPIMGDPPGG